MPSKIFESINFKFIDLRKKNVSALEKKFENVQNLKIQCFSTALLNVFSGKIFKEHRTAKCFIVKAFQGLCQDCWDNRVKKKADESKNPGQFVLFNCMKNEPIFSFIFSRHPIIRLSLPKFEFLQ